MLRFLAKEVTATCKTKEDIRILADVPDIDPRNAGQGLLPLMVACLTGKRHAVTWFVIRGQLQPV